MRDISRALLVLKLNKNWREVGISSVGKALIDLVSGVIMAMDIEYELDSYGNPIENKSRKMGRVDCLAFETL